MKVPVLLALLEKEFASFKAVVSDYTAFFTKKQDQFRGCRHTYTAEAGTLDEPSQRKQVNVVTTVDEKLDWFRDYVSSYLSKKLDIESTNACGNSRVDLIVNDIVIASQVTSMELMALKTFLENRELHNMLSVIPVRSDGELWSPTSDLIYKGRSVFEDPIKNLTNRTTMKESYIIPDPNIEKLKDSSGYKPILGSKDTPVVLGKITQQNYSGEWTHSQRARLLKRKDDLLKAVIVALKRANDIEVVQNNVDAKVVINFILTDK